MRATSTIESIIQQAGIAIDNQPDKVNETNAKVFAALEKSDNVEIKSTPIHMSHITNELKRLIASKTDREQLLESICNHLTDKRGYFDCWIAVLDEKQDIITTAESRRQDSPPVSEYRYRSALAACLEYGGKTFGLISASIPSDPVVVDKEQTLFADIAYEVAHALHDIDLQEKNRLVDEAMKATQSQMVQTQKLATIGRLAASVAHEVNNNLTAILMASSFLLSKLEGKNPSRPEIETIKGEAIRTRSVVKNLLDFARQSQGNVSTLDINNVIRNSIAVLKHPINLKSIKLEQQYCDQELMVAVDKNQIMQVFCNLLNNALDAMSKGGSLTVKTGNSHKYAFIEITDTGMGIKAKDMETIFEPFFTTKADAKGTGLGLSISHNIIKQFGGKIEVTSKLDKGSTFKVLLPISQENTNSAE